MQESLMLEFDKVVNKKEAIVTCQVYLELCELKKYHNVKYFYIPEHNKICISAKKSKNGPTCVFIPITVTQSLNFLKIQNMVQSFPQKMVFVAIVQTDSTTVFYQLADNLLEPTNTTAKHLKEDKQQKLDSNLKRNRDILEQSALLGLKVTLK